MNKVLVILTIEVKSKILSERIQTQKSIHYLILFTGKLRIGITNAQYQKNASELCLEGGKLARKRPEESSEG